MLTPEELIAAAPEAVVSTALRGPPGHAVPKVSGKVRDSYLLGDGRRLLVATDRVSAFDRVVGAVPHRGEVLHQLSAWWFDQVADIVPHHALASLDARALLCRDVEVLPVEVVVRGCITGVTSTSLWTLYAQGVTRPYGLDLPPGLRCNDALPEPMVTPTTKAEAGHHDEVLSEQEIIDRGMLPPELWAQVRSTALALFGRGQQVAAAAGLVLVDTKYEFGLRDGELVLCDEIHTPDSSRFWRADDLDRARAEGRAPASWSKEWLRQWLADHGAMDASTAPAALPADVAAEAARRYIDVFERLTGRIFRPASGDPTLRLQAALEACFSAPWVDASGRPVWEAGLLLAAHGDGRGGDDGLDRPADECGVIGIFADPAAGIDASRLAFFGLYALQHRGQESAGIAAADGLGVRVHKAMGLVAQVFDEAAMRSLGGHMALGHTRYSTTGGSQLVNAQPYLIETMWGPLAVAHNGNLTNTAALRRQLLERGVGLAGSSDSEIATQMLAAPPASSERDGPDWFARIRHLMAEAEGAYSVGVQTRQGVFGFRDPHGLRPLCLGTLHDERGAVVGHVLASESCALATIGARYLREIEPGEIVHIGEAGLRSEPGATARAPQDRALCVFEYVYFSRPDSVIEGQSVHGVRQRMGERLAAEAPVAADVVIGVPDSAVPAAIGFAHASGIPFSEGLTKNRYIGRTFIEPTDGLRRASVKLKYNALRANLEGKRVVLVDDSIVRGTTVGPLVRLLREDGGASEVHVRVSSPPVRHPCFMGVNMASHAELIAHRVALDDIAATIGADSVAYLSYDGMMAAVGSSRPSRGGHCGACFDGRYPVDVSTQAGQQAAHEAKSQASSPRRPSPGAVS